jgi:hypothetical protein
MRYNLQRIADGEEGTDQTVRKIGQMVMDDLHRPTLRLFTLSVLERAGADTRSQSQMARAIYAWVKNRIRYVRDPQVLETVQSPLATLKIKAGDCDDHAGLVAGMALSVGITPRFVVVGTGANSFSHIYPELNVDGKWMPSDTTIRLPFGKAVRLPAKKIYNFEGEPMGYALGAAVLPRVNPNMLAPRIKGAVISTLWRNWQSGLINRGDLLSYLRVIDEGNSPYRGTPYDGMMRQAIQEFREYVDRAQLKPKKAEGVSGGYSGLNGFLSSIIKAVASVVTAPVKAVVSVVQTGIKAAGQILSNTASGAAQGAQAPVVASTPGSTTAVYSSPGGFTQYLPWIALGVAAIIIVPKLIGRR